MNAKSLALGLCVAGLAQLSVANLIVNGGFESEPNWGAGFSGDAGYTGFTGNQIPGWTIESGHGVTVHNTVLYPTISGNYSVNTDGEGYNGKNADMYQDFATSFGGAYVFSYDWKNWYGDTTPRLDVTLTDLNTSVVLYHGNFGQLAGLHTEVFNFEGTGNTIRLRVKENPESHYNDNAFIIDNFSVEPQNRIISGNVTLGAGWAGATESVAVHFEIRPVGSETALDTRTVSLHANGSYSFGTNVAAGSYDITAKGPHWLRQLRGSVVVTDSGATNIDFGLVNGDCDGDNEVTLADYALLASAFGSTPSDGNWSPAADLDGDEEVTLADYSILSTNFGQSGD